MFIEWFYERTKKVGKIKVTINTVVSDQGPEFTKLSSDRNQSP